MGPDQFGDRRPAQDLSSIFAGLSGRTRGCAVLTMTTAGIGGSRQKAVMGYNQPKPLNGFKASMSDWAALDMTAAVGWMRERYRHLCRSAMLGHFLRAASALGCCRTTARYRARAADRGTSRILEADDRAGALSRLCDAQSRRHAHHPALGLCAGKMGLARDLPRACSCRWVDWVMSPHYWFDDRTLAGLCEFSEIPGRDARGLPVRRSLGDAPGR